MVVPKENSFTFWLIALSSATSILNGYRLPVSTSMLTGAPAFNRLVHFFNPGVESSLFGSGSTLSMAISSLSSIIAFISELSRWEAFTGFDTWAAHRKSSSWKISPQPRYHLTSWKDMAAFILKFYESGAAVIRVSMQVLQSMPEGSGKLRQFGCQT